jgi:hypothetical protein
MWDEAVELSEEASGRSMLLSSLFCVCVGGGDKVLASLSVCGIGCE